MLILCDYMYFLENTGDYICCMRTSKHKENSESIMHSLGSLDDSCFMAFPMGQDSMWVSGVWCSHCTPVRGDHPHEASDGVNMLHGHVPFPRSRKANCGRKAGPCYLSLPPDHRAEAGANNHTRAWVLLWTPPPSRCPRSQIVAHVSRLGWTWKSPMSVVQKTNHSRPSRAGKKKARARGNEVLADAPVTGWRPWFFFPF